MNFKKLEDYLLELVDSTGGIDTQILIKKDGKEIYSFFGGFRDEAHKIPAARGDCFYLYSLTKPLTCTAAMQLCERGLLDLNAPVHRYLPYFKNALVRDGDTVRPPKRDILVWHLFSMQSGFNYDENYPAFQAGVAAGQNTRELLKTTVENIPFSFDAGERWQYCCRNHDTLGCLIEEISGMKFDDYLKKNIFEPLGIEHLVFNLDGYTKDRLAAIYRNDGDGFKSVPPVETRGYTENYQSGGQGLIGDIDSYSRFADAMANYGRSYDGADILSREWVDIMRTDRLADHNRADFRLTPLGYGYGLGVRTLIDKQYGSLSPIGEFGWDGAAGGFTMFDTENRLSVAFLTHCLAGNEKLDQFKIRNLVYEALGE